MRAFKTSFLLLIVFVLVAASPAQAWWGWLDELSGPGKFRGPQFQFRLVCFGEESEVKRLVKLFNTANLLTNKVEASNLKRPALDAAEGAWEELIEVLNGTELTFPVLNRSEITTTSSKIRSAFQTFRVAMDPPPAAPAPDAAAGNRTESAQRVGSQIERKSSTATYFANTNTEMQELIAEVARGVTSIGSTGILLSACSTDKKRRSSIELAADFWYADGTSDKTNGFANGEQIRLTTLMPLFSFRVFKDPRFDFLDVGVGAGVYWFSSRGFDSFSGVILQPGRFDFHAPTLWATYPLKGGSRILRRIAAAPTFRFDLKMFPAGFSPDAFAGTGDKHVRIPGELVRSWALFINLEPFLMKAPLVAKTPK